MDQNARSWRRGTNSPDSFRASKGDTPVRRHEFLVQFLTVFQSLRAIASEEVVIGDRSEYFVISGRIDLRHPCN